MSSVIFKYYEVEAVNQSLLKLYQSNHSELILRLKKESNLYYDEKTHFIKGGLHDVLLTTPDRVHDFYYFSKIEKPTKKIMSIVKKAYDMGGKVNLWDSILFHKYKETWKDETRIKDVWIKQKGSEYYTELVNAKERIIIDKEEIEMIQKTVKGVKDNFTLTGEMQKSVFTNYKGLECKGLIDWFVDGQVRDIKTTEMPLWRFPELIKRFGWDFQVVFYTELLKTKGIECKFPQIILSSYTDPFRPITININQKTYDNALEKINKAIDNYKLSLKGNHSFVYNYEEE